jgi:hypothetical protein
MLIGVAGIPYDRENTSSGLPRPMPTKSTGAQTAAAVLGNRPAPVNQIDVVPGTQPQRAEPAVKVGGPSGARASIPDGGDATNVRGWRGQRKGE